MALFVNNMSRKFASISSFVLSSVVTLGIMCSCKDYVTTTATEKYVDNLEKFHSAYFMKGINSIKCDNLALYVDYSTCTAMGQNSPFFQALIPCWVNAAKDYYSIKGSVITKEEDNTPETGLTKRNVFSRIWGWVKEKIANRKLLRNERKMENAARKEYMAENKQKNKDNN